MAQVAVSILQSLNEALPVYNYFGKNHTPPEPGSFTGLTLPPTFGILRNQANRWVHRGHQYMATLPPKWAAAQQRLNQPGMSRAQQEEAQATVDCARIFSNHQEFIPGREGNINHHNEADIVRTASLYLLHPVGQALWADPDYNRAFYSRVEDIAMETRADVTFYRNDMNGPRSFAVVEFKRRTIVDGNDFSHNAILRAPAGNANLEQLLQQIVAPSVANSPARQAATQAFNAIMTANNIGPNATLFSLRTERLIKQASAYAIQHRTRHVILFNYDFMICCYFPWLDTHLPMTTLRRNNHTSRQPYPVEVDIYPRILNNAPNPEMRLALLGFLQDAIVHTMG